LLNQNIKSNIDWSAKFEILIMDEPEDSIIEEAKKNVVKRFFDKRAQKKSDIKEGLLALEEKRLRENLRKKINPSDTLYESLPQYQFHKTDLDYYLANFKDTIYKSELDWSQIQRINPNPFNPLKSGVRSNKFIYGFHPFWMGNAYYNYNFEIYNRIAYYGYIIDPSDGGDLSTFGDIQAHSWTSSTIQFKANYYNCKVDLCVASYDIENNIKIFENTPKALEVRQNVIENIVTLVRAKGNGVCFDIQKVPNQYKSNYISLIQSVNNQLNEGAATEKGNKKFQITVLIPRYDVGFPYSMTVDDANALESHVDRWIFSAESTYGNTFSEGQINESNMYAFWNYDQIDFELNVLPPNVFENLLLEIPFYYAKSKSTELDTSIIISKFLDMDRIYPEFSSIFNDALREKLTYVDLKGINGVATWCIGYDNNHKSIFKNLVDFIKDKSLQIDEGFVSAINNMIEKNEIDIIDLYKENQTNNETFWLTSSIYDLIEELKPRKIMTHHLIVLCLVILLSFVFVGFVISLFFEAARAHIFSKENIMNFSSILVILVVVLIFKKFRFINETEFVFIVGIFTGLIFGLIFYRRKKKKDKELKP